MILTIAQKTCDTNMLAQAGALGCGASDYSCLCSKPEFHYGIHDCAYQHCAPDNAAAASAVAWGDALCATITSGITTTVSNPATYRLDHCRNG